MIQCTMRSVILSGLDLHRHKFGVLLDDKIHLPHFLLIKIIQRKSVAFELLGKHILHNAALVDPIIAVDDPVLHVVRTHGAQKPRIRKIKLKQIMLPIDRDRLLGFCQIVARQSNACIGQPVKTAFISLHARRFGEIGEHKPFILGVEFGRDRIEDERYFLFSRCRIFGDILSVKS